MRPRVARERKRQYVRARRSRYWGDHACSSACAGRNSSAAWTERTAPVDSSRVVEFSGSTITARPTRGLPPRRRRAMDEARTSATSAAATAAIVMRPICADDSTPPVPRGGATCARPGGLRVFGFYELLRGVTLDL